MTMKVKKAKFSEWYTDIIREAELMDYSSVGGSMVIRPYAYAIWEKIVAEIDQRFKDSGIKNAYFPLLIPERLLRKEARHFEGFNPEVAWVTHAGRTKLPERLAIRPTSETIMYESYTKWIRSWRDLPMRINQWNNVVRWEFKHPTPFLRTREFLWNEGHTVFATQKEAEEEGKEILGIYQDIQENLLALPGILGQKTDTEKFAGAVWSMSFEHIMPDGRAIQGSDFHHDGQNFAKVFDINFLDKDGKRQYVWQNTFAITTRIIGVMLATHGDDKGLVLPPKIAPIQIVIIPIYDVKNKKKVLVAAEKIKKDLSDFSVELDDRQGYTPGWKFNQWEVKGIPLRIEIGPKDLVKREVVLARRDTGQKKATKQSGLKTIVSRTLNDIQKNLLSNAQKTLNESITEAKTYAELKKILKNQGGFVKAGWCGTESCEEKIKDETGAKITNLPIGLKPKGNCIKCGRGAKHAAYFARSY